MNVIRNMKVVGLGLIGVVCIVAGCTSTMGNTSLSDPGKVDQIKVGVTSKTDVVQLLGQPYTTTSVNTTNGTEEIWFYMYGQGHVSGASLIPVIGPFVGTTTSSSTTVQITFDSVGIVKTVQKSGANQRGTMVNPMGTR